MGNLFDTCVSVRDHFVKQDTISPIGYVDQSFLGLPEERQFRSSLSGETTKSRTLREFPLITGG